MVSMTETERAIRRRVNERLHEAIRNRERHNHIVWTIRGLNRRSEQPRLIEEKALVAGH